MELGKDMFNMWILDKNGAALYDINQCKEIYIVDFLDVEVCYGKELKNKYCRTLGKYENVLEAQWAFEKLVEWMENPNDKKVFRMPYEMPKEKKDVRARY